MTYKEKKTLIIVLAVVLAVIMLAGSAFMYIIIATYHTEDWRPSEGNWYNEELQIMLSFDDPEDSYILHPETGKKVSCDLGGERDATFFYVYCTEADAPWEKYGDVFDSEYVVSTNKELILRDRQTKMEYVFRRTD